MPTWSFAHRTVRLTALLASLTGCGFASPLADEEYWQGSAKGLIGDRMVGSFSGDGFLDIDPPGGDLVQAPHIVSFTTDGRWSWTVHRIYDPLSATLEGCEEVIAWAGTYEREATAGGQLVTLSAASAGAMTRTECDDATDDATGSVAGLPERTFAVSTIADDTHALTLRDAETGEVVFENVIGMENPPSVRFVFERDGTFTVSVSQFHGGSPFELAGCGEDIDFSGTYETGSEETARGGFAFRPLSLSPEGDAIISRSACDDAAQDVVGMTVPAASIFGTLADVDSFATHDPTFPRLLLEAPVEGLRDRWGFAASIAAP